MILVLCFLLGAGFAAAKVFGVIATREL